ncbi:Type-1 restriction enzyme EcoKI specificity protein [Planctomycetes bacterium Pla86]|uniref:Type-1 restriction enzyme EcoKI specificity protein n=2 Tax=Engelhardtia mirabilis TaxID=2528011 RepID=A0A518BH85_9BACT|nr:Type-1 restriction enzyme EcoKI specificity protein [Planctomycetes bacterium Pla133]QDV00652.1 Type-1 restriction enzyme EcoKI specificity protein [Planctomycetes bacterium Pla86]
MGDPPGDVAIYPHGAPDAIITADCVKWSVDPSVADSRFLAYATRSPAVREQILDQTKGVAQRKISLARFKAVKYPLAPLAVQQAIASALDSYFSRLDDAVANLERVQRNLKRYRASVLKAAVEGRLVPTEAELARAEGRDYEPASVLLERILAERRRRWEEAELEKMLAKGKPPKNDKWKAKYKEPAEPDLHGLPELPEGWCWTSLEQIAVWGSGGTPKRGQAEYYGGEIPWAVIGDLTDGPVGSTESTITPLGLAESSAKLLPSDSVLLAMYGSIGKLGISTIEMATNQAIAFAHPVLLTSRMLFTWLLAHRPHLVRQGKGGTQQNISQTVVKATVVPLPPIAELARIVDVVDAGLSHSDQVGGSLKICVSRIQTLRASLLGSAFRGTLLSRVDQESSDLAQPVASIA